MKKVGIVTVNYNTAEATISLLKSLGKIKTPGLSVEIIVVDNGSEKKLEIEKKQRQKTKTNHEFLASISDTLLASPPSALAFLYLLNF